MSSMKTHRQILVILLILAMLLSGCTSNNDTINVVDENRYVNELNLSNSAVEYFQTVISEGMLVHIDDTNKDFLALGVVMADDEDYYVTDAYTLFKVLPDTEEAPVAQDLVFDGTLHIVNKDNMYFQLIDISNLERGQYRIKKDILNKYSEIIERYSVDTIFEAREESTGEPMAAFIDRDIKIIITDDDIEEAP